MTRVAMTGAVVLGGLLGCPRLIFNASPVEPGQCQYNADCAEPLVCAGAVCREQCQTDRDCPASAACRPSDQRTIRVCLPPEAPSLCVYNSDCPEPTVCARDGLCRLACAADRDCANGATCVDGLCTGVVPSSENSGQRDAGVVERCDGGPCPLRNDRCEDALELRLTSASTSLAIDPSHWTPDGASCGEMGDGYFRFTLAERSLVVVKAGEYAARLGWLDDGCASITAGCDQRYCQQSNEVYVVRVLEPGEHWFVMDRSGPIQLTVTRIPVPTGIPVQELPRGTTTLTLGGPSTDICSSSGPAIAMWFTVCNEYVAIRTCGTTGADTDLAVLRPGSSISCTASTSTDRDGGPCAPHADTFFSTTELTVGVVFLSGATASDTGPVILSVE